MEIRQQNASEVIRITHEGVVMVRNDSGDLIDTWLRVPPPEGRTGMDYVYEVMRELGLRCAAYTKGLP